MQQQIILHTATAIIIALASLYVQAAHADTCKRFHDTPVQLTVACQVNGHQASIPIQCRASTASGTSQRIALTPE